MFLGEYRHSIDNKDRLTVPARYRELLDDGAYILRGFDRNLMVLTTKAFEAISQRLSQMSLTDPLARDLRRLIFGSTTHLEVDKAGRILIPDFLCQKASLTCDKEAILVGQGSYFEIWSSDEWALQQQALDQAEANTERFKVLDLSTST
ncbi:MAG: division/cell wall cluster transcriptional repressor MraZ [Chloroflexi bacterium RBG_19FT_COMBO_49_13]|nr:MAG: division/cell wall cluster transcriptional repressor MraZ [Chloroflexi bacterium RBG_19FT_COMBO_49_13]